MIDHAPTAADKEILILCSRKRLEPEQQQRLADLVSDGVNWESLSDNAKHHGVCPLVIRNLKQYCRELPPGALTEITSVARRQSVQNFQLSLELLKIARVFQEKHIEFLPFKGPALAIQAYSDLSLRTFADLDLVISESQVGEAIRALIANGFEPLPRLDAQEMDHLLTSKLLMRLTHEHTFEKVVPGGNPILVDLHWNLSPSSFDVVSFEELAANTVEVELCGQKIATMKPEYCLVAIAMHGTKHQFSFIRWLVDVAELVQTHPDLDWDAVHDIAKRWGGEIMVDLALYMCINRLGYSIALPESLRKRLQDNNRLKKLQDCSLEAWFESARPYEPNLRQSFSYSLGTLTSPRAARFLLIELFQPTMVAWKRFPLPSRLFWGYHLVQPSMLLGDFLVARSNAWLGQIKSVSTIEPPNPVKT